MKTLINRCLLLLFVVVLISCKDDETPSPSFSSGVWIVNEGALTHSNSSISSYNISGNVVTEDIFGLQNNHRGLGDVTQSVTVDGDRAYIVVDNDNKVEVVNAKTFVSEHTIKGTKLARYFTVYDGKGYLTEWYNFSDSARVVQINLTTFAKDDSVYTGFGAENIIAANGKLFVSNSFESTVAVIDPSTMKRVKTIDVASSPGQFVVDKNGKLWVACGGNYEGNDGALYCINTATLEVDHHIDLSVNIINKLVTGRNADKLYYMTSTYVFAMSIDATEAPVNVLIAGDDSANFYGLGFELNNEEIYIGDALDFSKTGKVYRYKPDGTLVKTISSGGIAPNGFVFR